MGLLDRLFRRDQKPAQRRSYDAATGNPRRFNSGQARFSSYGSETIAASAAAGHAMQPKTTRLLYRQSQRG